MIDINTKKASEHMTDRQAGKKSAVTAEYWRVPLDDIKTVHKEGIIHIIPGRCKGCGFCIEFCPKDVLVQSEGINEKGYHPPEVKNLDACVYCRLCEMICPDIAIFVEVTKSNEDELAARKKGEDRSEGH